LARLIIETKGDPIKAINALDAILRSCKVCSDRLTDLKTHYKTDAAKDKN